MTLYRLEGDRLVPFQQEDFPEYEDTLETWIKQNSTVVLDGETLLIIGRQQVTAFGKNLDLLGVDSDGNTIIVELKKGRAPREVLAQPLEYTAWVQTLSYEDLDRIALQYFEKRNCPYKSLMHAYREVFLSPAEVEGEEELETRFNQRQRMFIIAQKIGPEVEAVARFLRKAGVDIYCMEFAYYVDQSGQKLLDTEIMVGREEVETPPYNPFREPLERIEVLVRERLEEDFNTIKASKPKKDWGKWFYFPKTPYEGKDFNLYFRKNNTIRVSLAINIPINGEEICDFFQQRAKEIEHKLGSGVKLGKTGEKTFSIYEDISWSGNLDDVEGLIEPIAERVATYISFLYPMAREYDEKDRKG
ncbi:hypothetical protein HKBW3C_00186 [Candidatus Hakubella thermalkaliphila]|nr:hypothetical protein HKBW3C_00186 [Candidatus Hakubella thermalkaliphila]